jgi:hypothetical membrane protein
MAGVFFFVASTQFALGLVVAEALYPGYSVSGNYISDLGIGPSSMIFNSSIFLLGLLSIIGSYFLSRDTNSKSLSVLFAVMSIGAMGAGIFTKSLTVIHGAVSSMAFLFAGLSAIASFKVLKRPLSVISVILGVIVLGASALFATGLLASGSFTQIEAQDSVFFLGLGPGGMERMIVYPALIWITGFSGYIIALPEKQTTQE